MLAAMSRETQFFATCLVEALRPETGMAVVRLLERLGVRVECPPGQTCCGQPAFNAGTWDEARAMARHTLEVLDRSEAPVVVPSGSCTDMIVHHYPELLAGDARWEEKARRVAARTHEFSEYLTGVLGLEAVDCNRPGRYAYHPSCHLLRGLGIRKGPVRLLEAVGGAELKPLADAEECCGFGGLFSVKMSEISGAMLDRKLDAIAASGAETVVGCDVSCLVHIEGGLKRRGAAVKTRHLAEVLADPE
jgi:L-lactate dehydrogenase complex protein LldE